MKIPGEIVLYKGGKSSHYIKQYETISPGKMRILIYNKGECKIEVISPSPPFRGINCINEWALIPLPPSQRKIKV